MAAASATSTALPPGYHAPLVVSDPNHHGAWIVICNALGLAVALICLAIRVYIRTKVSPPFGRDDHALTASTALAMVQSGLIFAQVHAGFGRSLSLISSEGLVKAQQFGYAADIFYIAALYASKCCVVLLYKRISRDRRHSVVAWTVLSMCITLAIVSILLVALRCNLSHPWLQYGVQCDSLSAQRAAVAAFDIITEVFVFAMSIQLVWNLQTSVATKGRVVLAFGLRLPLIAIAVLRLHYIKHEVGSTNPTLVGAKAAVLTQVEIFYSIMSATVPCLRPFLAGFVTNYGAMGSDTIMGGSQIGTGSRRDAKGTRGSFALNTVTSAGQEMSGTKGQKSVFRPQKDDMGDDVFRPNRSNKQSTVSVTHNDTRQDQSSLASSGSTKMTIKKQVEYSVSEGIRTHSQMDMCDLALEEINNQ